MEQLLSAARRRIKDLEHEIAQRNLEARLWPTTPRTPKNVQLARVVELESSRDASCYQRWPCLEPLARAKEMLDQLAVQESRYSNLEREETATDVSYDHYSMAENETFQSVRTALDSAFKNIFEQLEVRWRVTRGWEALRCEQGFKFKSESVGNNDEVEGGGSRAELLTRSCSIGKGAGKFPRWTDGSSQERAEVDPGSSQLYLTAAFSWMKVEISHLQSALVEVRGTEGGDEPD